MELSSAEISAGNPVQLSLNLQSSGKAPASVQWTIHYSTKDFTSASISAGAAMAGKSLSCEKASGSATCVIWGFNDTVISNGVLANVQLESSTSAPDQFTKVQVVSAVAAAANGNALSAAAQSGGLVQIRPGLNGFTCSAVSLLSLATAICAVKLTSAALSTGESITLAVSPATKVLKVPHSVLVEPGASKATFIVVAEAVTAATPVTLTASHAGVEETFGITVKP